MQSSKSLTISEDCLVLNIWTPNAGNNNTNKSQLKPIMFWIYGGAFVRGSIFFESYNGSILATHDVVIVSTNYRLGQFGFLYGDREDAPGNVGFYDQLLALKWVRENIHSFGGDRDQITIFGESAGSRSVSAHILSPLSKGLFKRAILESGAHLFNKDRDVQSKAESIAQGIQMAQHVNCSQTVHWLQCLRNISAEDMLKLSTKVISFPILGTEFLPISAKNAFKTQQLNSDIDILSGITRTEGSILAVQYNYTNIKTIDDFKTYIRAAEKRYHGLVADKVADFYLNGVDIGSPPALQWAFYQFFGDLLMGCPTYLFTKHMAAINLQNNHNVYFYRLDYQSQTQAIARGCNESTMGICHGADLSFVFGIPYTDLIGYTPMDREFSTDIMNMWTTFAKTG
ncbi:unnamed protein product [Medioppia subpectinata]|uniref:Carboxylic ester hydrolase n=1 Tax=Medioppia subpectinata TaxID=1979941 RepID=A0A7R9KW99_9ACAR|nr:unnamed protein product [Medioppia subpectinata]CAG2111019.1 unnamed protein product [Medioppia subpectinata]